MILLTNLEFAQSEMFTNFNGLHNRHNQLLNNQIMEIMGNVNKLEIDRKTLLQFVATLLWIL